MSAETKELERQYNAQKEKLDNIKREIQIKYELIKHLQNLEARSAQLLKLQETERITILAESNLRRQNYTYLYDNVDFD